MSHGAKSDSRIVKFEFSNHISFNHLTLMMQRAFKDFYTARRESHTFAFSDGSTDINDVHS